MTREEIVEKQLEFWDTSTTPISANYQPQIPLIDKTSYKEHIIPGLIRLGAIPKNDLEIGKTYEGYCRNAHKAVWLGDKFEYQRYKFGETFPEKINHFEDDNGYDLFVPYKKLD